MRLLHNKILFNKKLLSFVLPCFVVLIFFAAYSTLSIVRHDNYQSYGYDLGINDQTVWRYAHFQAPITTIDPFPDKSKLVEHIEFVYMLIAPFYWIWETRRMLLLVAAGVFCLSGFAVYLFARKKNVSRFVSLSLMVAYLGYYGVQNAFWADVHSASFATSFLMWFIYALESKKKIISMVFFLLAITAKENIGLLTFLIAAIYFYKNRSSLLLFYMISSVFYVAFIYFYYFPYVIHFRYLYQNDGGYFSNLNPFTFIDSSEKRQVLLYSFLSFGFLPLVSPLYLIPFVADLATYFVVANQLPGAQGLYGQYRITLTPFLLWASAVTLGKLKFQKSWYLGVYLLVCTLAVQYVLHLPLSYLTKEWFWHTPTGVKTMNEMIKTTLPKDASVVSQNNITPHLSHRDQIYTLYPETHIFQTHSPCGQKKCDWFHWYGHPVYLIVDTSPDWDARHFLVDRSNFVSGLYNLTVAGVITPYKSLGSTTLYKVNENPSDYK